MYSQQTTRGQVQQPPAMHGGDASREHLQRAGDHAGRSVDEAGAAASEAGAAARTKGREAADRAAEATSRVADRASDMTGKAAQTGAELAGRAREAGAEMVDTLKHRAGEAYEQVAQQTRGIAESARHMGDTMQHRVEEGVQKLQEVAGKADVGVIRRFLTAYQGEPWYQKAFIGSLFFLNTLMPLIYIDKLESWVVLLTNLASTITMFALFVTSGGYTRLLGLAHAWWLPMLAWINSKIRYLNALLPSEARPIGVVPHTAPAIKTADLDWFNGWLKMLLAFNTLALCMDAYNVLRYASGDRGIKTKHYEKGYERYREREQQRGGGGGGQQQQHYDRDAGYQQQQGGGFDQSASHPASSGAGGARERQSYAEVAARGGVAGRAY